MRYTDLAELAPWADPAVTEIGRLPMEAFVERDERSRISLDGEWRFRLFESPTAVTDAAVAEGDDDSAGWRTITVPGEWTLQDTGDLPHYTNVSMPFSGRPPELPARNPTGVYRTSFRVPGRFAGRVLTLSIGAADSAHAVFVNGRFAGYGTDNQLASTYDIGRFLRRRGANSLAVVVIRFSAQSYVEDQDRWWMAGLHRTVTLEGRPPVRLQDVEIDATLLGEPTDCRGGVAVRATVAFAATTMPEPGWRVRAGLERLDGRPVGRAHQAEVPFDLSPYVYTGHVAVLAWSQSAIRPWTAETPDRYRVRVTLIAPDGREVDEACVATGFRKVEIVDRELRVNGRRIIVQGVNRHDHHPDRGRALHLEDMRADLVAMKRANVNAIRTSHYPNDPRFLGLCDELGLYVVAEANIESHAFNTSLCDDPRYRSTWLARGERLVRRDRNHPSVILWSLGNESGYGTSHEALAGLIRRLDPTRPLHYEGAVLHEGWEEGGLTATDVVCPMYSPLERIEAYARDPRARRPLVLCEYSHAMGNSNGSLADYWALFERYPLLQGGFVWEWKDMTLRQRLPDGRQRLAYGGQFGDSPNDGNFVADGLMSSELRPHPALAELAWCHRPLAVNGSADEITIRNRQSFRGTDWLTAQWELLLDGELAQSGRLALPDIPPLSEVTVPSPVAAIDPADGREAHLLVRVRLRRDEAWAERGHVVATDQIVLAAKRSRRRPAPRSTTDVTEVLRALPTLNLRRAPTDNDGYKIVNRNVGVGGQARRRWFEAGIFDRPAEELVRHQLTRSVRGGALVDRHFVDVPPALADLPRIGVVFALDPSFLTLRWFGRGPHECYPDRQSSAHVGLWEAAPDELPYAMPQEFGLRTDCRWFEACSPSLGLAVRVVPLGPSILHVSATHHLPDDLEAAREILELRRRDHLTVAVDVVHRGLGTASCGPDVLERYRIGSGRFRFAYRLEARPLREVAVKDGEAARSVTLLPRRSGRQG